MKSVPTFALVLLLFYLEVLQGYMLRLNARRGLRVRSSPSSFDRDSPPSQIIPVPFSGTGCILLAQPQERDHFLIKGSLLVIEHGDRGSVGVLLDKSTPYSVKETSPGLDLFDQNTMFMGGGQGNDLAVMIHKHNFGGLTQPLGYGLYIGGIKQAEDAVRRMEHHPHDFKFIFNCVEWGPGGLEKEIEARRWDVCAMPPDLVLRQNPRDHTPLWSIARNALTQHRGLHKAHTDDDDL